MHYNETSKSGHLQYVNKQARLRVLDKAWIVKSRYEVNRWHSVIVTWSRASKQLKVYIDGKSDQPEMTSKVPGENFYVYNSVSFPDITIPEKQKVLSEKG